MIFFGSYIHGPGVGKFFSVNVQIVNILDFVGLSVSALTTHLCCCIIKPAIDNS